MKILAFVASALILTSAVSGATFVLAVLMPAPTASQLAISTLIVAGLSLPPLVVGATLAGSIVDPGVGRGTRYFRGVRVIMLGIQAAAIAALVAYAIAVPLPAEVALVFALASIALCAANIAVGRALGRRDAEGFGLDEPWHAFTASRVTGMIASIAVTFGVVFCAVYLLYAGFVPMSERGHSAGTWVARAALQGFAVALAAASITCSVLAAPLAASLRRLGDHTGVRRRDVAAAVLATTPMPAARRRRVAAYALVLAGLHPFQIAQVVMLACCFIALQVAGVIGDGMGVGGLNAVVGVLLSVGLVVFVVVTTHRVRGVRRFALDASPLPG